MSFLEWIAMTFGFGLLGCQAIWCVGVARGRRDIRRWSNFAAGVCCLVVVISGAFSGNTFRVFLYGLGAIFEFWAWWLEGGKDDWRRVSRWSSARVVEQGRRLVVVQVPAGVGA